MSDSDRIVKRTKDDIAYHNQKADRKEMVIDNDKSVTPGFVSENRIFLEKNTILNNRYRIEREIGKGGFGSVFMATDMVLKSKLALKILDPTIISTEKKFLRVKREINLSRKIADERIVKIYSLEKWNTCYFLVMEYVEGKTLKEILNSKGRMKWPEFKEIFFQILQGMAKLHNNGILHRDLKPSNIMISDEGKIKILDFGLAKEIMDNEKTTSIGELVGSPHYVSPEQARGEEVDFRSDIYQLGLLLYTALSGSHPFKDANTMQILYHHIHTRPEKLSSAGLKIPRFLEFGIERALEKKKEDRFDDVSSMLTYFKKERLSILKRVQKKLTLRPVFSALIILSSLLILLFIYSKTIGAKNLHSVESNKSILTARNIVRIKLWERDFAPYQIYKFYTTESETEDNRYQPSSQRVVAFLSHPLAWKFPAERSINAVGFDSRIAKFDFNGNEISNRSITEMERLKTYDFIKSSQISSLERKDIDKDGEQETILVVRHSRRMFPTAFILLWKDQIYSFSNPGGISYYNILKTDADSCFICFFGYNNIISHLRFFSEVQFSERSLSINLDGIPVLKPFTHNNAEEFLVFLPNGTKVISENWQERGTIDFINLETNEEINLSKDSTLRIKSIKGTRTYRDEPSILKQIYMLLNRYYRAKTIEKNFERAGTLIGEALKYKLGNPYLKSALLFFQGDLMVLRAEFEKGRQMLTKSLAYYPYNADAAQRICEIDFLTGKPLKAVQDAEKKFSHLDSFWGMSWTGKILFKSYCYLHEGHFDQADISLPSVTSRHTDDNKTLKGVVNIFKGDYKNALSQLKNFEEKMIINFTVQEYRLLLGRAMVLAGEELDRAEFYFTDIAKFSRTKNHLAEISVAYLLALRNNLKGAEKLARPAFSELLKMSKGDFETRLWLFYDAYIYGKTMEMAGNKEEAIRGYQTSLSANPHTDLARRSRAAIQRLRK